MLSAKSVTPLIVLHQEFEQFRFFCDVHFLKEYLKLLFLTHKVLLYECVTSAKRDMMECSVDQIVTYWDDLISVSVFNLLSIVDITTQKLATITNMHQQPYVN